MRAGWEPRSQHIKEVQRQRLPKSGQASGQGDTVSTARLPSRPPNRKDTSLNPSRRLSRAATDANAGVYIKATVSSRLYRWIRPFEEFSIPRMLTLPLRRQSRLPVPGEQLAFLCPSRFIRGLYLQIAGEDRMAELFQYGWRLAICASRVLGTRISERIPS